MSVPDPKKWEATGAEVWDISGADANGTRKIIAAVARRRALEELRAVANSVCEACADSVPKVMCGCGCNRERHTDGRECYSGDIHSRIAEIEAEGE